MIKNIYANEVYEATINNEVFRLRVFQDECADDPRSWDNLSTMWIWWNRWCLGDKKPSSDVNDCLDYLLKKYLKKTTEDFDKVSDVFKTLKSVDDIVFREIYVYEHSGITLGYSDYGDPWDSGCAGFAFVEKETIINELCLRDDIDWKQKANEALDREMEIYTEYVKGNTLGFSLEKLVHKQETCLHCEKVIKEWDEFEEQDSCWGFYGNSIEENGMEEFLPEGFFENAILVK